MTSLGLESNVYAFDSTTIELCLETFKWALFRKNQGKGGINVHTLYDVETSITTFFHITEARVHDMNAMDAIPYEENSFYIFDRGYNDFKRLHNIESIGAYFVVRGRKNNDFKPAKWTRRFPPDSGVLSDAVGYMNGQFENQKYPDLIRRISYQRKGYYQVHLRDAANRKYLIDRHYASKDLYGKPNYNKVNERFGSNEPSLFDCLTLKIVPAILLDTHGFLSHI